MLLLSLTRAALSSGLEAQKASGSISTSTSANTSSDRHLTIDTVEALARQAALSPSLTASVLGAARETARAAGLATTRRRAELVRSAVGLDGGESCALVNGRRCAIFAFFAFSFKFLRGRANSRLLPSSGD